MTQSQAPPVASLLLFASISVCVLSCEKPVPKTKLIYFGLLDHSEKADDVVQMAKEWGHSPPCPNWQATIKKDEADYEVLFKDVGQVTIIDHRGRLIYAGGTGPLYLPHGNPNGTGVNLCKLMDEAQ
jgi:hypothetical protein